MAADEAQGKRRPTVSLHLIGRDAELAVTELGPDQPGPQVLILLCVRGICNTGAQGNKAPYREGSAHFITFNRICCSSQQGLSETGFPRLGHIPRIRRNLKGAPLVS